MKDKITLTIGGMAPPFFKQLQAQGVKVTKKDMRGFQKMALSLVIVRVHELVSYPEARKGEKRLVNKIIKTLKEMEKL